MSMKTFFKQFFFSKVYFNGLRNKNAIDHVRSATLIAMVSGNQNILNKMSTLPIRYGGSLFLYTFLPILTPKFDNFPIFWQVLCHWSCM